MNARTPANASILISLLWCLALLAVLVVGTLHSSHLDLRVGKNHGDLIQARYLAVAGAETAKALLYHDALERRNAGLNHTGDLYDAPRHFRDVSLGRGRFRVVRPDGSGADAGPVYGVSDEESRINPNTASAEMLENLQGVDLDLAASLVAYREERNPFRTLRELLLVGGVSPTLLFGDTTPRTPGLSDDPTEDGLSRMLTVHSSVRNVNARGDERIDVQNADESALQQVPGITSTIAAAIVAHRGQNQIQTLADLLDVGEEQEGEQTGGTSGSGSSVIDENLLIRIADNLTVDNSTQREGLININTASAAVLASLPDLDREIAYAIVSHRASSGFFENVAELLRVPGMTRDILSSVYPQLTARSETYRIISEGSIDATGARSRIQIVVRMRDSALETLFYKEES